MDLSAKLIIKASLNDDTRRMVLNNDEISYTDLVLMMQRVFKDTLNENKDDREAKEKELSLKYKDEDGDLITILNDSDLSAAIQQSRKLRLYININKTDPASLVSRTKELAPKVAHLMRKELLDIGKRINTLLDALDSYENADKNEYDKINGNANISSLDNSMASSNVSHSDLKEFDPLRKSFDTLSMKENAGPDSSSQTIKNEKHSSEKGQFNSSVEENQERRAFTRNSDIQAPDVTRVPHNSANSSEQSQSRNYHGDFLASNSGGSQLSMEKTQAQQRLVKLQSRIQEEQQPVQNFGYDVYSNSQQQSGYHHQSIVTQPRAPQTPQPNVSYMNRQYPQLPGNDTSYVNSSNSHAQYSPSHQVYDYANNYQQTSSSAGRNSVPPPPLPPISSMSGGYETAPKAQRPSVLHGRPSTYPGTNGYTLTTERG